MIHSYLFLAGLLFACLSTNACASPLDKIIEAEHQEQDRVALAARQDKTLRGFGFTDVFFLNKSTNICPHNGHDHWTPQPFRAKNSKEEVVEGSLCCHWEALGCIIVF